MKKKIPSLLIFCSPSVKFRSFRENIRESPNCVWKFCQLPYLKTKNLYDMYNSLRKNFKKIYFLLVKKETPLRNVKWLPLKSSEKVCVKTIFISLKNFEKRAKNFFHRTFGFSCGENAEIFCLLHHIPLSNLVDM